MMGWKWTGRNARQMVTASAALCLPFWHLGLRVGHRAARTRWLSITRQYIRSSTSHTFSLSLSSAQLLSYSDTVGLDTRLTSCVAHDGSHESQQELLDSDGCSLDTSILPNVQERIINRSGSTIKLLYANFQAFRFPDRDHLHLKCTVVVCKGKCLMVHVHLYSIYQQSPHCSLLSLSPSFRFMVTRFKGILFSL